MYIRLYNSFYYGRAKTWGEWKLMGSRNGALDYDREKYWEGISWRTYEDTIPQLTFYPHETFRLFEVNHVNGIAIPTARVSAERKPTEVPPWNNLVQKFLKSNAA